MTPINCFPVLNADDNVSPSESHFCNGTAQHPYLSLSTFTVYWSYRWKQLQQGPYIPLNHSLFRHLLLQASSSLRLQFHQNSVEKPVIWSSWNLYEGASNHPSQAHLNNQRATSSAHLASRWYSDVGAASLEREFLSCDEALIFTLFL